MPGYYALLKNAVSKLPPDDLEGRERIYQRSRVILSVHLSKTVPPLSDIDAAIERTSLESAIAYVEAQYKKKPSLLRATTRVFIPQPERTDRSQKKIESNSKRGMLSIIALLAIGIAPALAISFGFRGNDWLLEQLLAYVGRAVPFVMVACLMILAPLAVGESTRGASVIGLLVASYFFGAATWLLAFEGTIQYAARSWILIGPLMGVAAIIPIGIIAGGAGARYPAYIWIFLGLFLGVVGMVPIGIVAGATRGDYLLSAILVGGFLLALGMRSAAFSLAASI